MESSEFPNKNYKILVQDKFGCFALKPFESKDNKIFTIDKCDSIKSTKHYISIINSGKLFLYSTSDFSLIKSFDDLDQIVAIDISPNEKYLTIIQKPSVENNLKVFSLSDYSVQYAFHSGINSKDKWPQIYFNKEEDTIFKHIKGVLEVYQKPNEEVVKIATLNNIVEFVNYEMDNSGVKEIYVAAGRTIIEDKKNSKKSFFSIFNIKDCSKPIKEMATSLIDSMKLKISPDNNFILVNSINDNTTSSSYYGSSSLYFSDLQTGKFNKFTLPDGPIHDFAWLPNGENFIICAGHFPSKTMIYRKTGGYLKDIVLGKFNTVLISPDSRLLALGGFGSLNGDIEIYRLDTYQLIGKANMFCCVNLFWSYDSKYLLGSVLSTRVRVDNEYKIFTYNGEIALEDKEKGDLYNCLWVYSGEQPSNFDIQVNQKSLEVKKKPGVMLTGTLGTINFGTSHTVRPSDDEIPGLGKKKKKKNKK